MTGFRTIALVLLGLVLFGPLAAMSISAAASTTSYATLAPSHLAAAVGGAVSDLAAAVYCSLGKVLGFDPCEPEPASAAPVETQAAAVSTPALPPTAPAASTSPATTTPASVSERVVTERIITKPVIERTAPMYLTVSTTDPSLLDRLAALEAKVSALAQASPPTPVIFSTYGGGAASSAYVNTPGLTQKIDQLSGTTLTNVTLQGTVSGITSAMLPTDLTISSVIVVSGLQVRASQADPTPKTGDGRLSYQTWEVLTAGALRPWPPRAASHRSELSSCPPEVVRPAADLYAVCWRGAVGTEVGPRLGAREPVF
jgi:hypothetical protein